MQFSNEESPSHPVRTVAWAHTALGRRIAVLVNEPIGQIGYAAASLPDGPEETWEIHVRYPRVEEDHLAPVVGTTGSNDGGPAERRDRFLPSSPSPGDGG